MINSNKESLPNATMQLNHHRDDDEKLARKCHRKLLNEPFRICSKWQWQWKCGYSTTSPNQPTTSPIDQSKPSFECRFNAIRHLMATATGKKHTNIYLSGDSSSHIKVLKYAAAVALQIASKIGYRMANGSRLDDCR
ncbi:uncharacterized protein LOC121404500 [Drosophila obscura]|uniref:uncharacterized protein LOC121404500 n=1 Tax=Drosophila obscura TaxID=7282 RepID=UPI001BB0FF91|nr:uncharacterized protein LOC121404500 [Drosophila obscura]